MRIYVDGKGVVIDGDYVVGEHWAMLDQPMYDGEDGNHAFYGYAVKVGEHYSNVYRVEWKILEDAGYDEYEGDPCEWDEPDFVKPRDTEQYPVDFECTGEYENGVKSLTAHGLW